MTRLGGASLAEILSGIAIIASTVTFLLNLHTQQNQNATTRLQNDRGLLLQLRGGYTRISAALEHGNSSGLETELTVSSNLLRTLSQEASGGDYYFLAHAYVVDDFPERAVPLYRKAIARIGQPALRLAAIRGLAGAEADLENATAANEAMQQAVMENERSKYPGVVKAASEFNTERVWAAVDGQLRDCAGVQEHARRFYSDIQHTWISPATSAVKEVEKSVASCG